MLYGATLAPPAAAFRRSQQPALRAYGSFLHVGSLGAVDDVADAATHDLAVWRNNATSYSRSTASAGSSNEAQPITCGEIMVVTSSSDKYARCPEECPLMVADAKTDRADCDFLCVGNSVAECKANDPRAPVPDLEKGFCRACTINGCHQCSNDGSDTCAVCSGGYRLDLESGRCVSKFRFIFYIIFSVIGVLLALVLAWVIELNCRAITNESGLQRGLEERSRAKLHMPADPDNPLEIRRHWPWFTNLCNEEVAGHGILLLFTFQAMVILWGLVLVAAWGGFIVFVDYDLAILGTRSAQSPWENCWVVQWGFETQRRLMWAKLAFCTFAYAFTFAGCILYGIFQLRSTEIMDEEMTTHMDFAAKITGLPEISGKEKVEAELKELIESVTSQTAVGVSVSWDMQDKQSTFLAILENELDERELYAASEPGSEVEEAVPPSSAPSLKNMFSLRYIFSHVEGIFLSPTTQWIITKGRRKNFQRTKAVKSPRKSARSENAASARQSGRSSVGGEVQVAGRTVMVEQVDTATELASLYTCKEAFVVFNSEEARDKAVEVASTNEAISRLKYRNSQVRLHAATCEPQSVLWGNYHNYHAGKGAFRFGTCVAMVLGALLAWTFLFYLPYLWYAMSFNYAYGQEPGVVEMLSFSIVVMLGNAVMYFVCSAVADRASFKRAGDREVCYFLLYTFACMFNVCLDLYLAYYIAYKQMVGLGMKTYYGTPLRDVKTFPERFETYAMQRELGNVLLEYAFPSTFLLPFLFEPIITIYIPYRLMVCFVRCHPELTPLDCEAYLENVPMDLSRYADLLLNVMLATLILYFPGGFNLLMFGGLVISHIYIYMFDQYRVLRAIPACNFSKATVDWWAQWMFSIPCGCILSCLVFKSQTERTHGQRSGKSMHHSDAHAEERYSVFWLCLAVFIGHVVLHTVILRYVIPLFARRGKKASEEAYAICSSRIACSWFTSNPIHCLRSTYIYGANPGCDYCIAGKEHLIRTSAAWGVNWHSSKKSF